MASQTQSQSQSRAAALTPQQQQALAAAERSAQKAAVRDAKLQRAGVEAIAAVARLALVRSCVWSNVRLVCMWPCALLQARSCRCTEVPVAPQDRCNAHSHCRRDAVTVQLPEALVGILPTWLPVSVSGTLAAHCQAP